MRLIQGASFGGLISEKNCNSKVVKFGQFGHLDGSLIIELIVGIRNKFELFQARPPPLTLTTSSGRSTCPGLNESTICTCGG